MTDFVAFRANAVNVRAVATLRHEEAIASSLYDP